MANVVILFFLIFQHTSLNSRGRLSVGWSSAALRYMSLVVGVSCSCGGGSCSGWNMGGGRGRWSGQWGSSDWPMCTVRSHGISFKPGHILKSTWLLSWQMSESLVKDSKWMYPCKKQGLAKIMSANLKATRKTKWLTRDFLVKREALTSCWELLSITPGTKMISIHLCTRFSLCTISDYCLSKYVAKFLWFVHNVRCFLSIAYSLSICQFQNHKIQ